MLRNSLLMFAIIMTIAATAHAVTIQLPQTGQTTCYDTSGTIIPCTGTGQDGATLTGISWPNPRFVDNGDQTVTDKLTGLMWSKDANWIGAKTWQEALDYIKILNSWQNSLGHKDWRLPNRNELESLVNKQQSRPDIWLNSQGFINVQPDYYLSSSTVVDEYNSNANAVVVNMEGGSVEYYSKHYINYVWPVRDGQIGALTLPKTGQTACYDHEGTSRNCTGTGEDGELQKGADWPNPRFSDNDDQTVTDNLTGLVWSKDAKTPGPAICGTGTAKTWQGALEYVKCLNYNSYLGRNKWYLPNRNELASLTHHGQSNGATWLNMQGFINVQSDNNWYWSSSTIAYSSNTNYAWTVNMDYKFVSGDDKASYDYV